MREGEGRGRVVEPKQEGTLDVRASLMPGTNQFKFTAARLGTSNRSATLTVEWRGPAADAMERRVQADPAKYLPPASAGLNRKLPPPGRIPAVIPTGVPPTFS